MSKWMNYWTLCKNWMILQKVNLLLPLGNTFTPRKQFYPWQTGLKDHLWQRFPHNQQCLNFHNDTNPGFLCKHTLSQFKYWTYPMLLYKYKISKKESRSQHSNFDTYWGECLRQWEYTITYIQRISDFISIMLSSLNALCFHVFVEFQIYWKPLGWKYYVLHLFPSLKVNV